MKDLIHLWFGCGLSAVQVGLTKKNLFERGGTHEKN
jgi:hypothetical protein